MKKSKKDYEEKLVEICNFLLGSIYSTNWSQTILVTKFTTIFLNFRSKFKSYLTIQESQKTRSAPRDPFHHDSKPEIPASLQQLQATAELHQQYNGQKSERLGSSNLININRFYQPFGQ